MPSFQNWPQPPESEHPSQSAYHSRPAGPSVAGNPRITRRDRVSADGGETRSELLIREASAADNGTYHCRAENKARST